MNFSLILTILLAVALAFVFHQVRLLQGELYDIRILAGNGVTLDELEQSVVPAVEALRSDSAALRRDVALLSAAVVEGRRAEAARPATDDEYPDDGDAGEVQLEARGHVQLQALLSNVAAVFGNFSPDARPVLAPSLEEVVEESEPEDYEEDDADPPKPTER